MAGYKAALDTELPPAEVFAYLSDFSNAAEWDPGTVEATRVGDEPLGEGTEFRLVAEFLGRRTPLSYRVAEYDPPSVVTLRGENATVVSVNRMTFVPSGAGTHVAYDAKLTLKGARKLADPLLALAFRRVGDAALAGMRDALARRRSPA